MNERIFKIRIEEMPVVGGFLLKSFDRDFNSFKAYSPLFDASYKTNFATKLAAVDAVVNPKKLKGEITKLTEKLYAKIDELRKPLLLLEGYVERGSDLTGTIKSFGISDVRKKIKSKDQEGLLESLKVLFKSIDDNFAALEAVGYTTSAYDSLKATRDLIKNNNLSQNEKLSEKELLVENNIGVLNELWQIMSDVMDAGKRIYKVSDTQKVNDYTLTKIKARIRHEKPIVKPVGEKPVK